MCRTNLQKCTGIFVKLIFLLNTILKSNQFVWKPLKTIVLQKNTHKLYKNCMIDFPGTCIIYNDFLYFSFFYCLCVYYRLLNKHEWMKSIWTDIFFGYLRRSIRFLVIGFFHFFIFTVICLCLLCGNCSTVTKDAWKKNSMILISKIYFVQVYWYQLIIFLCIFKELRVNS